MTMHARQNKFFTSAAMAKVRTIKHCAVAIIGFVIGAEIIIMLDSSEDRAGGVFMGLLVALGALLVAIIAVRVEKAVQIKTARSR